MSTLPMFTTPIARTETDERYTPKWVFDALAETFDLMRDFAFDHPTHAGKRSSMVRP